MQDNIHATKMQLNFISLNDIFIHFKNAKRTIKEKKIKSMSKSQPQVNVNYYQLKTNVSHVDHTRFSHFGTKKTNLTTLTGILNAQL